MYDLFDTMIQVFGPAAVTLILLILGIARLWPVVVDTLESTRHSNEELVKLIQTSSKAHTESLLGVVNALTAMETRAHNHQLLIIREVETLRQAVADLEERARARDEKILRAVEDILRRINGG